MTQALALKLAKQLEQAATIADMGRPPIPNDFRRQAATELRRLHKALEVSAKNAARFHFLQNTDPWEAQAFFWNYTYSKQRAKAIDAAMKRKKDEYQTPFG